MDEIGRQLSEIEWEYADKDPEALAVLTKRIEEKGRNLGLITYSELVTGMVFHFPNINDGGPYQIHTYDWSGLDRRIIGDFLGYISVRSYLEHGFMASALVVNRSESQPSDIFFEWMESLDVLPNLREDTVLAFWAEQVKKAHNWYKYGREI